MKTFILEFFVASGLIVASGLVQAEDETSLIERARSAAPSMISDGATVMYQGEVLAEGDNGWICMPETFPGDESPLCNDMTWMKMMQAMGDKASFEAQQMGFSYMLGGDAGVSNTDPYHSDPKSAGDFIQEGPHLMLIVPKAMLKGITTDPYANGPYVMWKDTPYAHIMVPVGERE